MDKIVEAPFLRTGFNYDRDLASEESGLACADKTLAQQHFREECDINTIVERFHLTGEVPQGFRAPTFGDFTDITDYRTALEAVMRAEDAFMQVPAEIRARFDNDAQKFVAFCSDEKNKEELYRMKLAERPKEVVAPPPLKVEVVNPVPAAGSKP